ncbi:hypothetical protein R5R35_000993 [Gryllus longicercus]|uniref:B-related factor 1 n=1 Tax=Gryllus longicercus TaxID=2509291 RepID=A0AAN9VS14_9ORTH
MPSKCKNCGSTEIDVDPARGDTVCTSCGSVLEDSAIVSELQFEENCHGGSSAIGHFVSSESHGGASGFGSSFHTGLGRESREVTLANAKRAITGVAQQLRLTQHCIDTAHNFYKMALVRNLTKGRKSTHVVAACLYITCRVEGTPHLLIDFSDVLQICVYELGRTYLRLSEALCITIPSMDPCLYILRFAHRLDFGDKTHEVSMTALRLVQRMKRDYIHTGRRPSGLCGAALLMAARVHEFNRTTGDIVKIVKVHESTLRKRLIEFGETPSSRLTLDEFMTVDLEEEQDPPSFKASRRKDKERLQEMMEEESYAKRFRELQAEIETVLEKRGSKRKSKVLASAFPCEDGDADNFIMETTMDVINDYIADDVDTASRSSMDVSLGPNIASMGLATAMEKSPGETPSFVVPECSNISEVSGGSEEKQLAGDENNDDPLIGLDEDEIDSYIMSDTEARYKDSLWNKVNAEYLKEQKEKEEQRKREEEESKEQGKPEKKKKRPQRKTDKNAVASTPGEAITKMLETKKISKKINYDVLRSLTAQDSENTKIEKESTDDKRVMSLEPRAPRGIPPSKRSRVRKGEGLSLLSQSALKTELSQSSLKSNLSQMSIKTPADELTQSSQPSQSGSSSGKTISDTGVVPQQLGCAMEESIAGEVEEDDYEEEEEVEEQEQTEMSLAQMLNQHREDDMYGDEYYDDY